MNQLTPEFQEILDAALAEQKQALKQKFYEDLKSSIPDLIMATKLDIITALEYKDARESVSELILNLDLDDKAESIIYSDTGLLEQSGRDYAWDGSNMQTAINEYELIKVSDFLGAHVGNLDTATCEMLGDTLIPDSKEGYGYTESHYVQDRLTNHLYDTFDPESTIEFMNQPDKDISFTLLDGANVTAIVKYSEIYQYLPSSLQQDQDVKNEYDRLANTVEIAPTVDTPHFDPWADEPPIVKVVEQSPVQIEEKRIADMFSENQEKSFSELKVAVTHQFTTNFPNVAQVELLEHIDNMEFKNVASDTTKIFSEFADKDMHNDIKHDVVNFLTDKFGPDDGATQFAKELSFDKTMAGRGNEPTQKFNLGNDLSSYAQHSFGMPDRNQEIETRKIETPADITPDMLAEVAGAESFLQEHAATAPKTAYESNINWKPMLAATDSRLSEKTMQKELADKSFFSAAKFDQVRNYYDNTKSPTEFGMFSSGEHRDKYKALNEKAVADLGYGTTLKEMQTIQTKELALAHQVSNISRPEFNNTGMNPEKIVDIIEKKHDFERKYFQFRDNQEQGIANSEGSVKEMRESYMDYKAAAIGKDWRFEYKDKTQEAVKEIQVSPTQTVEVDRPNAPKLSDYSHANQEMIKRGEQRLAEAGAVSQSVFKDVENIKPKQVQEVKTPESAVVEKHEPKQEPKQEPEQKKQFSLDSKPKIANRMQDIRQKMELGL
jgi:hypothetical protein